MNVSAGADRLGILLAGGNGSRLHPITRFCNKQLLAVYDKPLIYYSLSTLMLAGLREIALVSSSDWLPTLRSSLGDGSLWGITLHYVEQPDPGGVAQAILLCDDLVTDRPSTLILGDNIFFRTGLGDLLCEVAARLTGATVFALPVAEPERFGVVITDATGRPKDLVEKPTRPVSNLAVPGLYFYDHRALDFARTLTPSARGELEITDLNRLYLEDGTLDVAMLGRGSVWLDCGTPEDLFEAGQFVRAIEERTGVKIACPEEVALRMGYIDEDQFSRLLTDMPQGRYADYLGRIRDKAFL